eukprot:COSAG02_NODE_23665_length_711_cov_1.666667_1_plen_21_part_10
MRSAGARRVVSSGAGSLRRRV